MAQTLQSAPMAALEANVSSNLETKRYPEPWARVGAEADAVRHAASQQPKQSLDQVLTEASAKRSRPITETRTADQYNPIAP